MVSAAVTTHDVYPPLALPDRASNEGSRRFQISEKVPTRAFHSSGLLRDYEPSFEALAPGDTGRRCRSGSGGAASGQPVLCPNQCCKFMLNILI